MKDNFIHYTNTCLLYSTYQLPKNSIGKKIDVSWDIFDPNGYRLRNKGLRMLMLWRLLTIRRFQENGGEHMETEKRGS